jgi:hypothetical protein
MFDAHEMIRGHGTDEARRLSRTKWEHTCINAAATMLETDTAKLAYASLMITSLPHRQPMEGDSPARQWRRQIGFDEYFLESGIFEDGTLVGVPFGAKARLALIYIHTQVIRQASPVLDVPHTRNAFLKALDMKGGGMTYKHVVDQTRRISACKMTISRENLATWTGPLVDHFIYDVGILPPSTQCLDTAGFARQTVFSKGFYDLILADKVKLNHQALQIISNNSWAIDLYIWFARELHRLKAPFLLDWQRLEFGSGVRYKRSRQMRSTFLKTLQLVKAVYPQARVEPDEGGFILHPSPPPL